MHRNNSESYIIEYLLCALHCERGDVIVITAMNPFAATLIALLRGFIQLKVLEK